MQQQMGIILLNEFTHYRLVTFVVATVFDEIFISRILYKRRMYSIVFSAFLPLEYPNTTIHRVTLPWVLILTPTNMNLL